MTARIITMLLATFILIPAILSYNNAIEIESDIANRDHIPFQYADKNEDVRFIQSILDAYRRITPKLATNFKPPHDQDGKYQVWKRNADIINTLLGFPRRMLELGR